MDITNKPVLYQFYPIPPIPLSKFIQFILPTEFVVKDCRIPLIPDMGRAYYSNLYIPKGTSEIVTYEEVVERSPKPFRGTYATAESAFLLEWYSDHGDDGHVFYSLEGFVFVRYSDLCDDFWTNWEKNRNIAEVIGDYYNDPTYK